MLRIVSYKFEGLNCTQACVPVCKLMPGLFWRRLTSDVRQRLLCNGKERKDDKETPGAQCRVEQSAAKVAHSGNFRLAAAGVGAKSKLMLMPAAWPHIALELQRSTTQARARLCNAAASRNKLSFAVLLLQGAFDTVSRK